MTPGSTNPVTAMSFEGNFLYVADGPILRSWNVNTKTWSTIGLFLTRYPFLYFFVFSLSSFFFFEGQFYCSLLYSSCVCIFTTATFAKTGGNAKINSIVVSSGGSRVYVGGDFTSVGGSSYNNLAVYDTGEFSFIFFDAFLVLLFLSFLRNNVVCFQYFVLACS